MSSFQEIGSFRVSHLDIHPQQRRRERLSLRIGHQAERTAATQALVKQKIQSLQIWQLKSLDAALYDLAKMLFDGLSSDFANEEGVVFVFEGDQADIRGVAFVT